MLGAGNRPRRRRHTGMFLVAALLLVAIPDASGQGRLGRRRPQPPDASAEGFDRAGPDVGDPAPDFVLQDPEGDALQLSQLWSSTPLILVLGSYTSPEFRDRVGALQRILEAHPREVRGAILYTVEAHPTGSKSPYAAGEWVPAINRTQGFTHDQPADLEARLSLARLTVNKLRIGVPVAVDGIDNAAWKAYGPAPNNAFLIDRHGVVVDRQGWFNPPAMQHSLETLLRLQPPLLPDPAKEDR